MASNCEKKLSRRRISQLESCVQCKKIKNYESFYFPAIDLYYFSFEFRYAKACSQYLK